MQLMPQMLLLHEQLRSRGRPHMLGLELRGLQQRVTSGWTRERQRLQLHVVARQH